LSDRIWRTRFHSDRSIVGREIMIDDEPFSVVGVMPPVAHPGNNYHPVADGDTVDVWTPFTYRPENTGRGSHYMETYARMKPGVTLEQAEADMQTQFAQLAREHPGSSGWSVFVTPLYDELVGPSRRLLLLLLGAVGLVLLIACANAANLLLARATSRQREIAVRAALGAGRSRLIRQMLAESLLVSLLGGLCGAAFAVGGVRALVALLPANFPRASAIHVNAVVFAFTFVIAIAVGLLFGLAPALQAARTDLQHAMREGGRSSSSGSRQLRLRNGLVVAEVALACVLLIGAGLMLRSFINLLRSDPGFQPERVLTASISLPNIKYKSRQDSRAFYIRLLSDLSAIPGVRFAGVGSDLPWTGYNENIGGLNLEGLQAVKGQDFHARYHIASENYFQALGVPLVRGRFFTPHDQPKSAPIVIINRVMARSYWGTDDVVGRRLSVDDNPKPEDWFTIVGVVGDIKDRPNDPAAQPAMWWPVLQSPIGYGEMSVAVRAQSESLPLADQVRAEVRSLDADLALADVKQMQDVASKSFSTARFALFLAALFAILAAALSAIGIYGVISYSVNQRTHEFGLRMALGANHWSLVRQVMGQGIRLAAVGIVLGLAGALALGRLMLSLLFEVKSADPLTFATVAVAAISIAAFACYLPARRATATDPMVALRAD
jgi:predicted permease